MAVIKPFQAIRPKVGLEREIAALPYDVYNREEAKNIVEQNPRSFLKIDRAETCFPDQVSMYDPCVYEKAHELLWSMVDQGELITEETECYYIYELVMNERAQTGIVACASIDDYLHSVIKKHENTRADKEEDRIQHVSACNAQTGPIFLAYRFKEVIQQIIDNKKQEKPVYDFKAEDLVTHRVWVIDQKEDIDTIRQEFDSMNEIYIADGHHRCASAVKVGLQMREKHPDYTGQEEFNFFLSVLFPDEQLMIMDYNRVIKDLNGYTEESFLSKLEEDFIITKIGAQEYRPENKGIISMYLGASWYKLCIKDQIKSADPVESLDVSILQKQVLHKLLLIQDPTTDQRISFVGGIRGLKELERRVNTDCKVAFAMYPTSIAELFAVSDAGMLMPPKSTWFEPKLRSGLFIHSII